MTSELLEMVREEILAAGGVISRIKKNKHYRVYWTIGEFKFVETVAFSPSDWRAPIQARAQIRRRLRKEKEHRRFMLKRK